MCCCMCKGPEGFLATDVKVIPVLFLSSQLIASFFSFSLCILACLLFLLTLSFPLHFLSFYPFLLVYVYFTFFTSHISITTPIYLLIYLFSSLFILLFSLSCFPPFSNIFLVAHFLPPSLFFFLFLLGSILSLQGLV